MTYHLKTNKEYLKNVKNGVIIRLDEGIGMSLLLNGEIYYGSGGIIAEIGHTIVEPNGLLCQCGKKGCLEAYCSLNGLVKQFNDKNKTDINTDEFITLLDNKNTKAIKLIKKIGFYLGISLSNIANLLNPEIIFIDGLLTNYEDIFKETMQTTLDCNSINKQKIVIVKYKKEATALGASLLTINTNLEQILFTL